MTVGVSASGHNALTPDRRVAATRRRAPAASSLSYEALPLDRYAINTAGWPSVSCAASETVDVDATKSVAVSCRERLARLLADAAGDRRTWIMSKSRRGCPRLMSSEAVQGMGRVAVEPRT